MTSFHEIQFPLRLALGATGGPVRRTDIVSLSSGRENRNNRWKNARRQYDVGSGMRSVADLYQVLAFFEARSGQLYGFRFSDPVDFQSSSPGKVPKASDQVLGVGDGETTSFQLRKIYKDQGGSSIREITKPVSGSVLVEVDGQPVSAGDFSVDTTTGIVTFLPSAVPADGKTVKAGFCCDVPVRFDIDRIDINLDQFNAGRIPSIPLIEIRP
jgi:uncharacterized protein (TIGR02217 family)